MAWILPGSALNQHYFRTSWLGTYGGGAGLLPSPWDSIAAGVTALVFYFIGVRAGLWYTSDERWHRTIASQLGAEAPPAAEDVDGVMRPAAG